MNSGLIVEGTIVRNKELMKKGLLVMHSSLADKERYCFLRNISGVPVKLERNAVVAQVQ